MTMTEARPCETRARRKEFVSDHALVRWLERIEGHDFTDIRDKIYDDGYDVCDSEVLNHLHLIYGITRGSIAQRMITPQVMMAIQAGSTQVNCGRYSLIIQSGMVVTIVFRRSPQGRVEQARRLRGRARNSRP